MLSVTNSTFLDKMRELGLDVDGTLKRFIGNEELYIKFLTRYPDENRMEQIFAAFKSGEKEQKILTAHGLKGVSINLGMTSIAAQCSKILDNLREDNDVDYDSMLKLLEIDYTQMCSEIRKLIRA